MQHDLTARLAVDRQATTLRRAGARLGHIHSPLAERGDAVQPTWVGWVHVTVAVLDLVEQRPRQQEVLEAHGALAQKDQVRVGRQAQLAVGSERVETLRLLRGGHALRCTQPAQWARAGLGQRVRLRYSRYTGFHYCSRYSYTTSFLGGGTNRREERVQTRCDTQHTLVPAVPSSSIKAPRAVHSLTTLLQLMGGHRASLPLARQRALERAVDAQAMDVGLARLADAVDAADHL